MIVIADISIPADQFPLGRVLDAFPAIEIELERLIPLREAIVPLFWVADGDTEAVEETLRADPITESVTRLTEADSRVLYEVEWSTDVDGLVQALLASDARLLAAEGTADVWDFRVQFRNRSDMARFHQACDERGISLTLRRLYNPSLPETSGSLSDEQYEALTTAYRAGYFEVPGAARWAISPRSSASATAPSPSASAGASPRSSPRRSCRSSATTGVGPTRRRGTPTRTPAESHAPATRSAPTFHLRQ